jgi:hypothetical protein
MTPGAESPVGRERPARSRRRPSARRPWIQEPRGRATAHSGRGSDAQRELTGEPEGRRFSRPGGAVVALTLLVSAATLLRWLASRAHEIPYYVADEYIYAALARGIAEHGTPTVRGSSAVFPALLEPVQTSPFFLFADIETAFRLTQALHALEMSLAAVPVFLLARRLALSPGVAWACAAVAVASPVLFWSAFTIADAVGYTLALSAVYLGVSGLAGSRPATQAAFVVVAGLATLARTQYVVLFAVVAGAAVVVEQGRLRTAVRSHWPILGAIAAGIGAMVVAAIVGLLGPYSAWIGVAVDVGVVARSVSVDALVIALAAGAVVVPGAIVGLDLVLSKPRSRMEHAFGAIALFLGGALAGLAALGSVARVQERYLIVLAPLPALLFAVWADRGMPRRRIAIGVAIVLGCAYAAVGLTGWDASHSATIRALEQFDRLVPVSRALPVALVLASIPLFFVPRRTALATLAVAIGVTGVMSFGAYVFDREHAHGVRTTRLPERKDWVDAARVGDVALLHAPGAERAAPFQQLYWNRSVDRVAEIEGADELDFFDVARARIRVDGELTIEGRPVTSPILAPLQGAAFTFADAELVRRTHDFDLVRPRKGRVTVVSAVAGRFRDGWLGSKSSIGVWPAAVGARSGSVEFALSLPPGVLQPARVRISGAELSREIRIEPGARVPIAIAFERSEPLRLALTTRPVIRIGDRTVAVRLSKPVVRQNR